METCQQNHYLSKGEERKRGGEDGWEGLRREGKEGRGQRRVGGIEGREEGREEEENIGRRREGDQGTMYSEVPLTVHPWTG